MLAIQDEGSRPHPALISRSIDHSANANNDSTFITNMVEENEYAHP